jgi:hypothetical protein
MAHLAQRSNPLARGPRCCPGNGQGAGLLTTDLLGVLRDPGSQRWVAEALELTAILLVGVRPAQAATALRAAGSLRECTAEAPAPFGSENLDRQRAFEDLGPPGYGEHEPRGRTHEQSGGDQLPATRVMR